MLRRFLLCPAPLPPVEAFFDGEALVKLSPAKNTTKTLDIPQCARKLERQLAEYAHGKRKKFEIPVDLRGTTFQKSVWRKLLNVPYGQTISYSGLAKQLGGAQKARAVGGAVNKNPIFILVPCHRVVGKDGSLTGFAHGLALKKTLLQIEGVDAI